MNRRSGVTGILMIFVFHMVIAAIAVHLTTRCGIAAGAERPDRAGPGAGLPANGAPATGAPTKTTQAIR